MRKENVVNNKGLSSRKSFVRDLPSAKSLLNKEQQPYFIEQAEGPGQRPAGTTTFFYNGGFTPALVIPVLAVRAHAGYSAGGHSASLYPGLQISGMTSEAGGFTLIELLVVVLIIGILASVALPQYKLAVAKARMTQLITFANAVTQAQKRYHLANGVYAEKWDEIDIDLTGAVTEGGALWEGSLYNQKRPYANLYAYNNGLYLYGGTEYLPGILLIIHNDLDSRFCYASQTNQSAQTLCKHVCQRKNLGTDGQWKTCSF